ncbi:PadR family transcriptional regulator [Gordonia sp. NPDC003429]
MPLAECICQRYFSLMNLTPTARAILGFLSLAPRSGYEIRQASRRSTGMIWGISDGQLYPQLHALSDAGLIEAHGAPEGTQARQRWRLTDAGLTALHTWLSSPSAPPTMRDEGLVKLMFADLLGADAIRAIVLERRALHAELRAQLAQVVPGAHRSIPDHESGIWGPTFVHTFGLDYLDMSIAWCDDVLAALDQQGSSASRRAIAGQRMSHSNRTEKPR